MSFYACALFLMLWIQSWASEGRGQGPLDFEISYFAINFLVENVFLLVELVKWNFTTIGPPGKMFLATSWKNPLLVPLEKLLPTPIITTAFGRGLSLALGAVHKWRHTILSKNLTPPPLVTFRHKCLTPP